MRKNTTEGTESSRVTYEVLEEHVCRKAQDFIQEILEEEVTNLFSRRKSERTQKGIDKPEGYRNGYGKPRKFALLNGTLTIRRSRVCNTDEKFAAYTPPHRCKLHFENEELRKDFGRKAREVAVENLDIGICTKKHAEFYRKIVNS